MGEYYWEFKGNVDSLNLPDFIDGPHIFWEDSSNLDVWYIDHEQKGNTITVKTKPIKVKKDSVLVKGMGPDRNRYWVRKNSLPSPSEFSGVEKIMTIGDVHGEYDDLVEMLISTGVVDEELNWNWGKGHVVFIGDILDRGSKVTECLWLIRKLERQARLKGGYLHYLLGNHEIMVLMKDTRYAAPKYKNICNRLTMNYYRFFTMNTELGRWLRNLNCVVKINDLIFVHGGLSPGLVDKKVSLDQLNRDMRYCLNNTEQVSPERIKQVIYYPENPLWYRGYLLSTKSYSKIRKEEVEDVLTYFDASRIIFGHTEVDQIRSLFQNRLIAVDVPFGIPGIEEQFLLIEKDEFYRMYKSGKKERLE
ncbi:MAG: metallophosphoesterase [Marinifilaceae bacterium]